MKKVLVILQVIVGIVVLLFAADLFWQAIASIIPQLGDVYAVAELPVRLTPLYKWPQLILSLFIFQVIAVYTKDVFDKLSVSK